jgi:hypothetical protein
MLFKQIYIDSKFLINNKDIYEFFKDVDESQESVTALIEAETVNWIFRDNSFREFFCADFFKNPQCVRPFFNLTEPFVRKNEKPGDIDLVLVDPDMPEKAIAFECKRIKINTLVDQKTKINGLQNIAQGIPQINKYLNLGFHQTYLMILALDDSKNVKTENVMLRSSEVSLNFSWPKSLKHEIGLIYVRITQQTKRHHKFMCGFGFNINKLAEMREQKNEITNKIRNLLINK